MKCVGWIAFKFDGDVLWVFLMSGMNLFLKIG